MSFVLGGLLLLIGWQLARALSTGQLSGGRYRRDSEPLEYWFHIVHAAVAAAFILWAIATPGETLHEKLPWRLAFLVLVGFPAAFWLVHSLQSGTTGFGKVKVDRHEEPGQFWLFILGHVAVIAFAVWHVSWWTGPRPPDFYDEVKPVLAAIRRDLPPGEAAEFRDVRIDPVSHLVCGGVFQPDGTRRRFFGAAAGKDTQVKLENDGLPNFERGYRRACSGGPVVPDKDTARSALR